MANVFEFPSATARSWTALERGFREGMADLGAEAALMDHVCGRLKAVYEKCQDKFGAGVELSVPGMTAERAKQLSGEISAYYSEVILELYGQVLLREIELYRLKFG